MVTCPALGQDKRPEPLPQLPKSERHLPGVIHRILQKAARTEPATGVRWDQEADRVLQRDAKAVGDACGFAAEGVYGIVRRRRRDSAGTRAGGCGTSPRPDRPCRSWDRCLQPAKRGGTAIGMVECPEEVTM